MLSEGCGDRLTKPNITVRRWHCLLYLTEDLKNAVGSLIATKHTNKDNILEISQMAEKYSALKLKELCCEFIFQNLKTLDEKLLMELYKVLPLLGEKAWLELVKGTREQSEVMGINMTYPVKTRGDFESDDDYKIYIYRRAVLKGVGLWRG